MQPSRKLFLSGARTFVHGIVSPPLALTVGILFGLSFKHPYMGEKPRGRAHASAMLRGGAGLPHEPATRS